MAKPQRRGLSRRHESYVRKPGRLPAFTGGGPSLRGCFTSWPGCGNLSGAGPGALGSGGSLVWSVMRAPCQLLVTIESNCRSCRQLVPAVKKPSEEGLMVGLLSIFDSIVKLP